MQDIIMAEERRIMAEKKSIKAKSRRLVVPKKKGIC